MIKLSFALGWQQPKCTQLGSKYFIFNNIVWMGSRSTLSEITHKHVRTLLPPGSLTVPPEYDLHACSRADIRPFLLMKVSPQHSEGDRKQFHLLLSLQFHSLSFLLKALLQPLNSPSWNTNVYLYTLNGSPRGLKDKCEKANYACCWSWNWRTCFPLRVLIQTAFVEHK